tara:strand:+ start:1924 stop:2331 length:408 start_codon:yes stop_codon:yes gene_type:complete
MLERQTPVQHVLRRSDAMTECALTSVIVLTMSAAMTAGAALRSAARMPVVIWVTVVKPVPVFLAAPVTNGAPMVQFVNKGSAAHDNVATSMIVVQDNGAWMNGVSIMARHRVPTTATVARNGVAPRTASVSRVNV